MNRLAGVGAAALLLGGALFGFACSDDDEGSDEDVAAIRAAIQANLDADAAADAEAYLATVTDDFVANVFGPFGATEEALRESPEDFLGFPPPVDAANAEVSVDGDEATAVVSATNPDLGVTEWFKATLEREGDVWLMDRYEPTAAEDTPDDAVEVDVAFEDFAFEFDEDQFEPGKPIVFKLRNDGEQPHFMSLTRIPADANLEELLESEEDEEGVVEIAGSFFYQAGQEGELVLSKPLEAGRYVMLCFISNPPDDPEGPPHYVEGMQADFIVD